MPEKIVQLNEEVIKGQLNGIYFAVWLHGIVHTAGRIAPLLGTGFF